MSTASCKRGRRPQVAENDHRALLLDDPAAAPPEKSSGGTCAREFRELVFQKASWVALLQTLQVAALALPRTLMPRMCKEGFGDDCYTIEGYFESAKVVAAVLATPIAGLLVDWHGPRKTLCWCICISSLPAATYIATNSIWAYYCVESLQDLIGGGQQLFATVCMTAIAQMSSSKHRTQSMGFIIGGFGMGLIIGGKVGGAIIDMHPPSHPRGFSSAAAVAAFGLQIFVLMTTLLTASCALPDHNLSRGKHNRDPTAIDTLREELEKTHGSADLSLLADSDDDSEEYTDGRAKFRAHQKASMSEGNDDIDAYVFNSDERARADALCVAAKSEDTREGRLEMYARALDAYDAALFEDPGDAAALFGKGVALRKMNHCAEALQSFDQALAIDPLGEASTGTVGIVWRNKALTLSALDRPAEALCAFSEACILNPENNEFREGRLAARDVLFNSCSSPRSPRSPRCPTQDKARRKATLRAAFHTVASSPALRWAAITLFTFEFAEGGVTSLERTYVMNSLNWSVDMLANLSSVHGACTVVMASLVLPACVRWLGDLRTSTLAAVSGIIGYTMMGFAEPGMGGLPMVYVGSCLLGFVHVVNATLMSLVSKIAPRYMRSSVIAAVYALVSIGKAVAPTVVGWVAKSYDTAMFAALHLDLPGLPFLLCASLCVVGAGLTIGPLRSRFTGALKRKMERLKRVNEAKKAHQAQLVGKCASPE